MSIVTINVKSIFGTQVTHSHIIRFRLSMIGLALQDILSQRDNVRAVAKT